LTWRYGFESLALAVLHPSWPPSLERFKGIYGRDMYETWYKMSVMVSMLKIT
jgi:hypothetical protein